MNCVTSKKLPIFPAELTHLFNNHINSVPLNVLTCLSHAYINFAMSAACPVLINAVFFLWFSPRPVILPLF